MNIDLSCPSKTFLLGEYLVLNEGSALTLNTKPRFTLSMDTRGSGLVTGIAPQSPAGQWIRQNKNQFKSVDLHFQDPHEGRGGFGASSAQFLLTYIAADIVKNPDRKEDPKIENIWRAFRQIETVSDEGLRPSGADIVGQFKGGLCAFQTSPFKSDSFKWPFEELDVLLVHTGKKLATHEHLRGLKRIDTDELLVIFSRAAETMSVKDAPAFLDSVNDYYAELLELGLVAENTQVVVASLLSTGVVRAAKGCGAMGSDVVAVFFAKEFRKQVEKILMSMQLNVVASIDDMDFGVQVTASDKNEMPLKSKLTKEDLS